MVSAWNVEDPDVRPQEAFKQCPIIAVLSTMKSCRICL